MDKDGPDDAGPGVQDRPVNNRNRGNKRMRDESDDDNKATEKTNKEQEAM